jgi:methylisocitrate lyase
MSDLARALRQAVQGGTHPAAGVWDPLSALLAKEAGFQILYLSGAALSASLGLPDLGLLTPQDVVERARQIVRATQLPLIVDADTGFGEAVQVAHLIRGLEDAGAAGVQIEDQLFPKRCGHLDGKQLIGPGHFVGKLRAAAAARSNPDFVILARTDARGVTDMADAMARGRLYLEAGADALFPEALRDVAEFAEYARQVPGVLVANMTEFGKTPLIPVDRFAALGYRLVLFPMTALRVAMQAAGEAYHTVVSTGTQETLMLRMRTRRELYDLIRYDEYGELDRKASHETAMLLRRQGGPGPGPD